MLDHFVASKLPDTTGTGWAEETWSVWSWSAFHASTCVYCLYLQPVSVTPMIQA